MRAPFPYFGGKGKVVEEVWQALGNVNHYLEPFFGSGAVLLNRPGYEPTMIETVNDKDGFICNVWRAIQYAPDEVSHYCDWPVNHIDLRARKMRLIANEKRIVDNCIADDKWYDAELAGMWIWAASAWIGSGLTKQENTKLGQRPHLSDSGQGVHSIGQVPHVGHAGRGVHSIGQMPYVSCAGMGVHKLGGFKDTIAQLSHRLRRVRVTCGDWDIICGGNWQSKMGTCGIFFDPPYSHALRNDAIYHQETDCAADVARWAAERGADKDYRIVIAGYDGEHNWLVDEHGWSVYEWKAQGGYGNSGDAKENARKERLWMSPHCLPLEQTGKLF